MINVERAPKIDIMYMRRFTGSFPELFEDEHLPELQTAIDIIYEMFSGQNGLQSIDSMFPNNPAKVRLCYGLLVAWWIVDTMPNYTIGVISTGGGMIKSKQIGGTKINFDMKAIYGKINTDTLDGLNSNAFGKKAKFMIDTSPTRAMWAHHGI